MFMQMLLRKLRLDTNKIVARNLNSNVYKTRRSSTECIKFVSKLHN